MNLLGIRWLCSVLIGCDHIKLQNEGASTKNAITDEGNAKVCFGLIIFRPSTLPFFETHRVSSLRKPVLEQSESNQIQAIITNHGSP